MVFQKSEISEGIPTDPDSKTTQTSNIGLPSLFNNEEIKYENSNQIEQLDQTLFHACGEDPYVVLKMVSPSDLFSFHLNIQTDVKGSQTSVYFCYDPECEFSELNKITIDINQSDPDLIYLSLPQKAYWLRIDPIDKPGDFQLLSAQIKVEEEPQNEATIIYVESPQIEYGIESLKNKMARQHWDLAQTMIVVSHEISETGAPLLSRKLSVAARKKGFHVILISLQTPPSLHREFRESCSQLFTCNKKTDFPTLIKELSEMGVHLAVLNTVVTGRYGKLLHDNRFRIVSLIHEMKCSCMILNAQEAMKQIALYADQVIFPSQQVKNDFLSVVKDIKGRCSVRPQGYYKEIQTLKKSVEWKNALIHQLELPQDAKIVIGAGTINFGKGVDLLPLIALELDQAGARGKRVHFIWLGSSNDTAYSTHVKNQIEKMGLQDRFHFLGFIRDEQKYMQCLCGGDIFALVSREDCMPSAVIEAMACGLPVIAFQKGGGAEELLSEGRGTVVDYLNLHSFGDAILRLLEEDSQRIPQMTKMAQQYVKDMLSFEDYASYILQTLKHPDPSFDEQGEANEIVQGEQQE